MDACSSEIADERKALEGLLDAFVSAFSIEEITSAYYKAGRNVDSAAEILSGWQDDKSSDASWMSDIETSTLKSECSLASSQELPWEKSFDTLASKGEHCGARSPEPLPNNSLDRHTHFNKHSRPKQRKNSYSIGTVSSFLGKGYAKPYPSTNGVCKVTKPLRLEVKEDDLREDVSVSSTAPRSEPLRKKDVDEFLFSLLGEGFLLGKDVIREVLGQCGYDAKKTISRLEFLATAALGERDVAPGDAKGKAILAMDNSDALLNNVDACSSKEFQASQKKLQDEECAHSEGAIGRNGTELFCMDKDKHNLSRELVESLFAVRKMCDDIPRKNRPVRAVKKKAVGRVVTAPFTDHDEELSPAIIELQHPEVDSEDEEDEYQLLRRAAKQNWNAKWKYYEAALGAFLKGDCAKANYFTEQANSYHEKAREADEKSAGIILETRKKGAQDLITIDVHEYHPNDAKKQLKCLLKSLSGIGSVRFLKVILETSNEDITKSTRKRMVLRLLEKESIKWTEEEGSPGTILIRLDEINPQNLSFA